jgi:hypothetical protein
MSVVLSSGDNTARIPFEAEAVFIATVITLGLSFYVLGVPPAIFAHPMHREMAGAYEGRLAATRKAEWPPEVPAAVRDAMITLAVDAADLPALALAVRDRWQREQLSNWAGQMLARLHEVQQATADTPDQPLAQNVAIQAIALVVEALASAKMIADPLPPLLSGPPHQASQIVYLAWFEILTLATAHDTMAGEAHDATLASVHHARAQQLRERAAETPAFIYPMGSPSEVRH